MKSRLLFSLMITAVLAIMFSALSGCPSSASGGTSSSSVSTSITITTNYTEQFLTNVGTNMALYDIWTIAMTNLVSFSNYTIVTTNLDLSNRLTNGAFESVIWGSTNLTTNSGISTNTSIIPWSMPAPVDITSPSELNVLMSGTNAVGWTYIMGHNVTAPPAGPWFNANGCYHMWLQNGTGDCTVVTNFAGTSGDSTTNEIVSMNAPSAGNYGQYTFRMNNTNGLTLSNGVITYSTNLFRFAGGNICFNMRSDPSNTSAANYNPNKVFSLSIERARNSGQALNIFDYRISKVPVGNGTNGFLIDGNWHQVKIPLSAFLVQYPNTNSTINTSTAVTNYSLGAQDLSNVCVMFIIRNEYGNPFTFEINSVWWERP